MKVSKSFLVRVTEAANSKVRKGEQVHIHFRKVVCNLTPSGYSNGTWRISNDIVSFLPEQLKAAIVEEVTRNGVGQVGKLTIRGKSWIVEPLPCGDV